MPRPRYTPTFEDQRRVRELAALGASQPDIAVQLRLPLPKLQKIFAQELAEGAAEGREHALRKLNQAVMQDNNIAALNFFIKAQCGWRDTGLPQGLAPAIHKVMIFSQRLPEPNAPKV